MCTFFRKWFDRAYDIAQDFDYKDFLWCELFVLSLGVLFGVSAHKALKYLTPFIALFAAFSAFQILIIRNSRIWLQEITRTDSSSFPTPKKLPILCNSL